MGRLLAEVHRRDALLSLTGWAHLALAVPMLVGLVADHRLILGINPWIKPRGGTFGRPTPWASTPCRSFRSSGGRPRAPRRFDAARQTGLVIAFAVVYMIVTGLLLHNALAGRPLLAA